jgi:hypothetical protein
MNPGAIAEHIPYVRHAYGLCDEIVKLFGAGTNINSNCIEVVGWARHMQVRYSTNGFNICCAVLVAHSSSRTVKL